MHAFVLTVWSLAALSRLVSLVVSVRNEKRLKLAGAVEHGRGNSRLLAGLHGLLYVGAIAEAFIRHTRLDDAGVVGLVLYGVSMLFLALVIRELGRLWTIRLLLAPEHPLNRGWLFRTIRHPNYFLNIVPELLGLVLLCHAWITAAVILPPYALSLAVRIRQEERVMRERFADYG